MVARQKTSPIEDMILVVSKLPWWAGLTLALVSYIVLQGRNGARLGKSDGVFQDTKLSESRTINLSVPIS
jgi:hypothetical protein